MKTTRVYGLKRYQDYPCTALEEISRGTPIQGLKRYEEYPYIALEEDIKGTPYIGLERNMESTPIYGLRDI